MTRRGFKTLRSPVLPLPMKHVDTDQIVPARFLSRSRGEGFADALFADLRRTATGLPRADFAPNDARYEGAQVLVARANFGSGSSREAAVYALWDAGIRAVIAPSFGDIFHTNALKNGLLPVRLPADIVEALLAAAVRTPAATVTVDLEHGRVHDQAGAEHPFAIDAFRRTLLLTGDDELGYTTALSAEIGRFEQQRATTQPWL